MTYCDRNETSRYVGGDFLRDLERPLVSGVAGVVLLDGVVHETENTNNRRLQGTHAEG